MGGKIWSAKEERQFWCVAIPQSCKRVGIDLVRAEKTWETLAREMQVAMGADARRQYTSTMLFEHYFQNIETKRRSPNAAGFVRDYLAKRENTRNVSLTNRNLSVNIPPVEHRDEQRQHAQVGDNLHVFGGHNEEQISSVRGSDAGPTTRPFASSSPTGTFRSESLGVGNSEPTTPFSVEGEPMFLHYHPTRTPDQDANPEPKDGDWEPLEEGEIRE